MVKFNLITGFLGSGKTTLLSNLLNELSGKMRIAVIQNEYAPTGVDGKELQQNAEGFKLVEINNGSVFCVCQLNNFDKTLKQIISEYNPDAIFLEASGLADPISVVELIQLPELNDKIVLDKIICLVDAPNFFRGLGTLVRFKHQIMIADTVVLNKTDLYNDNLNKITDEIKKLNPYAEIKPTTYSNLKWDEFEIHPEVKSKAAAQYVGQESGGRPDMIATVVRVHDKISEENLTCFIKKWQEKCPRIKGFINLSDNRAVLVQSVFNELRIKQVDSYTGPTEIIAFGLNLQMVELRKSFIEFSKIDKCCSCK